MIVAADAGALAIQDSRLRVGVFRVTFELLSRLAKSSNSLVINAYGFANLPYDVAHAFAGKINYRKISPSLGYMLFRLPIQLVLDKPSVFLGLSQAIPFTVVPSIGFVYDVGFLHHKEYYPDSYNALVFQTASTVKRSRMIITISRASKSDIISHYHINEDKVKVIYPGVSPEMTVEGAVHKEDTPYFLFVGSLKRQKNIPHLIRSFIKFSQKTKEKYKLYIIGGDYWRDPKIDKALREAKYICSIVQLGYVSDDELAAYYRGAVAFVSPSIGEGFCLGAAESLACGVPVIGSNDGAMPEVVGSAGIVLNPYDENELVSAMTIMTTQSREYYKRRCVSQSKLFSWDNFTKGVYEQITSIIKPQ